MADKALGMTLPIRLGTNGYFETTTDILTQVRSNLLNLLLTQKGERIFQPNFGCDLHRIVFEAQTDDGLSEVQATIEEAVSTWMPFVRVDNVQVSRDTDHNKVAVSIKFSLVTNATITDTIHLIF